MVPYQQEEANNGGFKTSRNITEDFGDHHCINKKFQGLLPLQSFFYSLCRNILVEGIPCTPSKPIKDSWHLSNQHITWMTFPNESIDAYMDTND